MITTCLGPIQLLEQSARQLWEDASLLVSGVVAHLATCGLVYMIATADVLDARMAISSQQQQLLTHPQAGAARIHPCAASIPVCRKDMHVCQHRCTARLTAPHSGFGGRLTTAYIKQLRCRIKHPLLPISAHVALHTFTAFPCCSASLNTSSALFCGPSPLCTATATAAEPASLRLPLGDGADETLLVCLPERPFSALAKLPDALVNTLMGQAGVGHGCLTQECGPSIFWQPIAVTFCGGRGGTE